MNEAERYPDIGDHALIADCHSVALVNRRGAIDWCCMPRVDAGSQFGRLLDHERGGHCTLAPAEEVLEVQRRYLPNTLVLETTFRTASGTLALTDLMAMRRGGKHHPRNEIVRRARCSSGSVRIRAQICPRFDYAEVLPWVRVRNDGIVWVIGGDEALVLWSDLELEQRGDHDLVADRTLREGDASYLSLRFTAPHLLEDEPPGPQTPAELEDHLDETVAWWERWVEGRNDDTEVSEAEIRSAIVLKALTYAPTGSIAAAATTSLPEQIGGTLNWDYRYSWIRDTSFAVRSLAVLGYDAEADGFRRFVERSSAGHARDLQIMYGVGGERRLDELDLRALEGYRGSRPVRIGNQAATQRQHDVYGELLELAWRWHQRGHRPDEDYWRFLVSLVDEAARRWPTPDRGIWESRGEPRHYVLSKAMCWAALDRGISLAKECSLDAPLERWEQARAEVRASIEANGYDRRRGVFVRMYWSTDMDASLLLLPRIGFVAWDDDRMIRTTRSVRDELEVEDGLLLRYQRDEKEGAFVCCSFWLAECLANQGRLDEARGVFRSALGTANDLGLFSEEYDVERRQMLGNFPLALSHLSHIVAAVALREAAPRP